MKQTIIFLLFAIAASVIKCDISGPETWQPVLEHDIFQGPIKSSYHHSTHFGGIVPQQHHEYEDSSSQTGDQCEVYKVGFTQDLYFQYIQFKTDMPEMKEFTLCFWSKFTNHSNDHPLFSYAVDGQPKAISSYVANTDRSSYFSLAVEGHTFYRLNYPLRLNRWYHTCQSWNGKTGEWQIWVNAERVGRGFHNRLVGHVIPSGGIAISGQEQSQLGGGFQEGKEAPKGAGGMLGEITMVQLYNVALTAGKAHKDHKHHHAHQYDHEGRLLTTPPPTTPRARPALPSHPLLTAGQRNPMLMLNLAGGQQAQPQPQIIQGQNYNAQLLNGQFVNNLVSRQLISGRGPQRFFAQQTQPQPQPQPITQSFFEAQNVLPQSGLVHPSLVNPANVQIIDNTQQLETHQLFKRQNKELQFGDKLTKKTKRDTEKDSKTTEEDSKSHKKRELFLGGGSLIQDNSGFSNDGYDQSLLDGLAGIGENEPVQQVQKQSDEREPAEAEVKAVMNICSGCDEEPFDKALVFGWRTVPKKLFSGAFYTPAIPECKVF